MDLESAQHRKLLHEEITRVVIGCAFEVIKELGAGFVESVYEKSLVLCLREKGLAVEVQHPIKVFFRNHCVGEFIADLFVEGKVIIEIKAVKALATEHSAQLINYLNATGVQVGLFINFGNQKLEYKRLTRSPKVNEGDLSSRKTN